MSADFVELNYSPVINIVVPRRYSERIDVTLFFHVVKYQLELVVGAVKATAQIYLLDGDVGLHQFRYYRASRRL